MLYIMHVCAVWWVYLGISFVNRLVELFTDTKNHHLCRQSSVLYLASFLARANFIPQSVTSEILSFLISWCGSYVSHGGNESSMDIAFNLHNGKEQKHVATNVDDGSDMYVDYSNRCDAL
jgi:hypothetical protein